MRLHVTFFDKLVNLAPSHKPSGKPRHKRIDRQVGPEQVYLVTDGMTGQDAVNSAKAFNEALVLIWETIREANRFVDGEAPWALKKTDPKRMEAVLYVLAESIRHVAIILQPFMPDSCTRILDQLAIPEKSRDFSRLNTSGLIVNIRTLQRSAVPKNGCMRAALCRTPS